jgi:Nucleotidyl transferase AbiEii toxin, Type IV TA system
MYREAIPDPVWRLLLGLSGLNTMQSAYLAGGTALAIQLGHRISADLDFFAPQDIDYPALLDEIRELGINAVVIGRTPKHCELVVGAIRVDCLRERIPLRFALKSVVSEGGSFRMADMIDIGRMKLHSIAGRGGKKDFFDLYCLTRSAISLEELLKLAAEEQGTLRFSRLLFLKGLIDFEEAEREAPPVMLWKTDWEQVKAGLTDEVKQIGRNWA